MNLRENEDLAWERYQQVVTKEDIVVCYDMSVKEFEHSIVHDLFKVFSSSGIIHKLIYSSTYRTSNSSYTCYVKFYGSVQTSL